MTDEELSYDDVSDPIALAKLFISGRSLKRGPTIQLVRDLVAIIESERKLPPAQVVQDTPPDDSFRVIYGIPNVSGYDRKPPINVDATPSGAVFLGPDANRYFTRSEALALAGGIARAAANAKSERKG